MFQNIWGWGKGGTKSKGWINKTHLIYRSGLGNLEDLDVLPVPCAGYGWLPVRASRDILEEGSGVESLAACSVWFLVWRDPEGQKNLSQNSFHSLV